MLNKKIKIISFLAIFLSATCVLAATTDFTANGDITISSVTLGTGTVDMTILDTSTSASWEYSSGTFTVTDPGTAFMISSSNSGVYGIYATLGGVKVACVKNSTPGTTYLTLPTTAGTYTIFPSSVNLANSLTYNSLCGAATCESGYIIDGTGAAATCRLNTIVGGGSSGGGGGGGGAAPTPAPAPTPEPEPESTPTTSTTYEEPAHDTTVSDIAGVPATDANGNVTLNQMSADATEILSGNVELIASLMALTVDSELENSYNNSIVSKIVNSDTPVDVQETIKWFVTYGTKSTKVLGAGERGGAVNSFKAAFGKLPTTQEDWNDVIKIGNGRWPGQTSETAVLAAKVTFKKIYLREANMEQPNDNAAVTVMAYGLRPANRNMDSEKAAIKIFKAIFKYSPSSATDWDAVRAIAYSGAVR